MNFLSFLDKTYELGGSEIALPATESWDYWLPKHVVSSTVLYVDSERNLIYKTIKTEGDDRNYIWVSIGGFPTLPLSVEKDLGKELLFFITMLPKKVLENEITHYYPKSLSELWASVKSEKFNRVDLKHIRVEHFGAPLEWTTLAKGVAVRILPNTIGENLWEMDLQGIRTVVGKKGRRRSIPPPLKGSNEWTSKKKVKPFQYRP
tara:strand:+ start:1113 stop:1727 length:615 start_codon:yes stop_codon:yes gene_type:complete